MTIGLLPELDEVEGLDVQREVPGEEYDLPLAKALAALKFWPELASKVWLDEGLEEVLVAFDLSDEIHLTHEHEQILRSRNIGALNEALAEEQRAAGVPQGFVICWALVRI